MEMEKAPRKIRSIWGDIEEGEEDLKENGEREEDDEKEEDQE